jgi:hypothetical protein
MSTMRNLINISEGRTKVNRLDRSAFIYLDPGDHPKQHAQCGTCFMFMPGKQRCSIFGPKDVVKANASCGLYVHGEPYDEQPIRNAVTPKQAGYVEGQVRCENCLWFNKPDNCGLFADLNTKWPEAWRLDERVDPKGCCNGFQHKR